MIEAIMNLLRCLGVFPYLLTSLVFVLAVLSQNVQGSGFQYVTCASVLKLASAESNIRLHSHDVKYGSGSGQQSVTGAKFVDDVNSYWVVRGPDGEECSRGKPVTCGSVVRLQHLQTRLFLHSHKFSSPLSGNQEVSCFGDGNTGDRGDNWVVECGQEFWSRDDSVRFKHQLTNVYLHASSQHTYGRPIAGQKEISGSTSKSQGNLWKAMEGVYMEPDKSSL